MHDILRNAIRHFLVQQVLKCTCLAAKSISGINSYIARDQAMSSYRSTYHLLRRCVYVQEYPWFIVSKLYWYAHRCPQIKDPLPIQFAHVIILPLIRPYKCYALCDSFWSIKPKVLGTNCQSISAPISYNTCEERVLFKVGKCETHCY